MARTHRTNVDYFPFLCKEGKAMYYIDHKYGNDGYATWVKILREIAVANNHFLNLSQEVDIMYLASKCRVNESRLIDIINDLCKLGELNQVLWDQRKVIWSDKFIENIQDAYERRINKCITLIELMLHLELKCTTEPPKKEEKKHINTHTILDNSIKEDTKRYYFKISGKIFNEKISEYMGKNCLIFLEQFWAKNKVPAREIVFEKIDTDYNTQDFNNENHLKNTYKSMHEKIAGSKIISKHTDLSNKKFNEQL